MMSSPLDRSLHNDRRREAKRRNKITNPSLLQINNSDHQHAAKEPIKPLNEAQRLYDNSLKVNDITFGIGPAGTGKTYFAAVRAAEAFRAREIERIIITRPAVEAGESLGFLPGDIDEKFEPYFRPVREALRDTLGSGQLEYALRDGRIEARPLAYLRGATLKNGWVIADEMQNSTPAQMKLLLTRIGEGARFVINGDPSQVDLPRHVSSGLIDAVDRLHRLKSIGVVRFTNADIVRHGLIQEIIEAYADGATHPDAERYNDCDDESARSGLNKTLGIHDRTSQRSVRPRNGQPAVRASGYEMVAV